MKKLNKKGFTIIELVIVIAVIAILAAVLIPTFSSVISNANKSAAMQACTAAFTEALANAYDGGVLQAGDTAPVNGWVFNFTVSNGALSGASVTSCPSAYKDYKYTYNNNTWTPETGSTNVTSGT